MSSLPLARTRAAATSGGSSTKNTCVARTRSAQRRRADDVAPARITTASTWCRCPSSSSAAWNCDSVVHAASSRSNTSKPDALAAVVFPAPGGPQSSTTRRTRHLRSMAGPAAVGAPPGRPSRGSATRARSQPQRAGALDPPRSGSSTPGCSSRHDAEIGGVPCPQPRVAVQVGGCPVRWLPPQVGEVPLRLHVLQRARVRVRPPQPVVDRLPADAARKTQRLALASHELGRLSRPPATPWRIQSPISHIAATPSVGLAVREQVPAARVRARDQVGCEAGPAAGRHANGPPQMCERAVGCSTPRSRSS